MEPSDLLKSEIPEYITQYIDQLRRDSNAGGLSNVEIEGRLGYFNKATKRFIPGVSERYYNEMKAALLKAYNTRTRTNSRRYVQKQMLDVFYNNKVRVSVDETTGKVLKDSRTNKITGVIVKTKEKGKTLDYNMKNHYSLRIGISREVLLEDKKKRSDAENYVKVTEALVDTIDRIKRIHEGARVKIKNGTYLKLLLECCSNNHDQNHDPFLKFAKSQDNRLIPSNIVNQVQWVIEDMSCVSSLDRRLIRFHDGKKFEPQQNLKDYNQRFYRIISLAGAFHDLPNYGYFPIPYGAYTGIIHIDNIETLSKYKKLTLHKNPDFQPINFRRKNRTTFILKDGLAKHVVDMSITRYSEQGLENLEDCAPTYEIEYDYNGKDSGSNKHAEFLKGIQALLYSTSPSSTRTNNNNNNNNKKKSKKRKSGASNDDSKPKKSRKKG